MKKLYFSLAFIGCFMLLFPLATSAGSIISVTPTPYQDITDEFRQDKGDDAEGDAFAWILQKTPTVVEYAIDAGDDDPAVIVSSGGRITWTNNGDGTVTINLDPVGLIDSDMEIPDGYAVNALNIIYPVEQGEEGPTVEATGMSLGTNLTNWQMFPPSEDDISFGWSLTGPKGETGFMQMFMADATVDFLSQINGSPLTVDDLAVFDGDNQATASVTEAEGGLLTDINVVFRENSLKVSPNSLSSDTVTKNLKVSEKLTLSSAFKRYNPRKNKQVNFFGFHKASKKNKKIKISKKTKTGNKWGKWKKIKTVRTNKNGKYVHKFTAKKKGAFKFRAKYKKKKSPVQTLTVRKASH